MYPLPINTVLGALSIVEVYEYYDRPVLFTCRNLSGQLYTVVFANEASDGEIWLYAPMSLERFLHMRSGGIELRQVFRRPEDGIIAQVFYPYNGDVTPIVTGVPAAELPEEWFPAESQFIRLETATLPPLQEEPKRKALSTNKEVIALIFEFIQRTRTEAPAKLFGRALAAFQDVINTIAAVRRGSEALKGALPVEVIDKMEMVLVGLGSGSFKAELTANEYSDLFGSSELGDVIDEFLRLVDHGEKSEQLREHLTKFNSRVSTKYLDFLKILDDEVEWTAFDWGSTIQERSKRAEISRASIKNAISIIEKTQDEDVKEIKLTGRLMGANVESRRFTIKVDGTNSNIDGYVTEEAFKLFSVATLSARYQVIIREITRTKVIMGDNVREHHLVDIRLVPESAVERDEPPPAEPAP